MNLTRRNATETDRPFVWEAYRRAYLDLVVSQFGRWDEEHEQGYFDEKWARQGFEVVEVDGVPAGALWTTDEGKWLRLREIFLLPEFQGRGIGSTLVQQEIDRARGRKKPLRLRVLRANRAHDLYERLGFDVCEEVDLHDWMEIE